MGHQEADSAVLQLLRERVGRRTSIRWVASLTFLPLAVTGCSEEDSLPRRLLSLFEINDDLRALGRTHLAQQENGSDPHALVGSILGPAISTAEFLSDAQLRQAVRDRVADDAFRGRFSLVDGWVLPRSLLDLMALPLVL